MIIEYLIAAAILFAGGTAQILLRRGMSEAERAGARSGGPWGAVLGYIAVGLGIVFVVAAVVGR